MASAPPPGEPPPDEPTTVRRRGGRFRPRRAPKERPHHKDRLPSGPVITTTVLVVIAALVAVLSALAIYGVRRYSNASKSVEAKNTLGFIARAGVAHYEREVENQPPNRMCGESSAVPRELPAGRKWFPTPEDFDGDEDNGWKCLKISFTNPSYYQYQYLRDGFVSKGLEDPAFEAVARGDIDDDGVVSVFGYGYQETMPGRLVRMEQVTIENEFE